MARAAVRWGLRPVGGAADSDRDTDRAWYHQTGCDPGQKLSCLVSSVGGFAQYLLLFLLRVRETLSPA
ncbi:hypothetical protein RRG08_063463 [Elysia crispata]|uniref:Uncharacterized protein n=1 Tax=Elysia crispata TaxID=231223 RepID=A0AAE1AA49_9GAST|nr:hypothetical protein RRG08_063463 [Elysia crispata]